MLKYEQKFNEDHSRIFLHVLDKLPSVSPCQSENFSLAFTVFISLVVSYPQTPVGSGIPKFLKRFNSEVSSSKFGSSTERDSYRAISTLKLAEIAGQITQDRSIIKIVQDQIDSSGIDTDDTSYSQDLETGWIDSFLSKFSKAWKTYLGENQVNLSDISLEEDQSREQINKEAGGDVVPNALLKSLVQKLERTGANSMADSQTPSASIQETSKFSLDDATFENDNSGMDESVSAQSLMQYIRNVS